MIRKVFKYRSFIWQVSQHLVRYHLARLALSDTAFLKYIQTKRDKRMIHDDQKPVQPMQWYLRQIDKVINRLIPSSSCVIRSLVKRDVLSNYGYLTDICFGLLKEDTEIRAHAWLSVEKDSGYLKVHQVS